VFGGKLTTYRNLAEQTVDAVYEKMGRKASPSPPRKTRLPGAAGNLDRLRQRLTTNGPDWLTPQSAEYLLRVYGTRAEEIVALAEVGDPRLREVVDEWTGLIGAAAVFGWREEFAKTLTDVVMRRTMVGYAPGAGFGVAQKLAEIGAVAGVWSETRAASELQAFHGWITRFLPRSE
jgi:glycerol-3-phosphate dehydrogenase